MSIEDLKAVIRKEIKNETYGNFSGTNSSGNKINLETFLETFLEKTDKKYVDETVDIFLLALMTAVMAKGIVYKTDKEGFLHGFPVGPDVGIIKDCYFAQTTTRHVDAVVDIKVPLTDSLAEINENKPSFCHRCNKCFGAKIRLRDTTALILSQ